MEPDKFLFEEEDIRTTLTEILHRNSPKWKRLSSAILKNKEDAEDAISEAVKRMLRRGKKFESREHMQMYMGRVVSNTALEFYKRRNREKRRHVPIQKSFFAQFIAEADVASRPDFVMEEEERYAEREYCLTLLRRGLEELPPNQYEAIRLTILGGSGANLRDLENASGIPRATLGYRYAQGLRTLRKYLTRELNRDRKKM